jgi:hypothetical protein
MKRLLVLAGLLLFVVMTPGQRAQTPAEGKANANLPIEFLTQDQKSIEVKFPTNDAAWETKWKVEWDMETLADANKAGITIAKNRADDAPVLFKVKRAYFKPGRDAP